MSDSALQEAERFLHPVLSRGDFVRAKTVSIVDKLFEECSVDLSTTDTKADAVVRKGLFFLERIQQNLLIDKEEAKLVLETPALGKTVDALLDLVSLEGIYPRLLPGVGAPIERRVRSVLQGGVSIAEIKDQNEHDDAKLTIIVDQLYSILKSNQGVAIAIQQRTLVDILAALLQLAYGPSSQQQHIWSEKLDLLINSLSPTILFPSLISLLHSTTPSWLTPHVTIPLSLLPMRIDGVRQTITFVAKSTPQRPAQGVESTSHTGKGPSLPLEVLSQISKVLSSIPGTITAEVYFDSVAPQLYALLEEPDPDAQRAAAYTISHGILSKRALGAPGTVGWKYFAEPLLVSIDPTLRDLSNDRLPQLERRRALKLLGTILSDFSNPALSKRLLSPIILPLWQTSCLADSETIESRTALDLLKLYFHTVAGLKGLALIADNLMLGSNANRLNNDLVQDVSIGGNESPSLFATAQNMQTSETMSSLDVDEITRRSKILMELIKVCPTDEDMGEFFATVLKVSLHSSTSSQQANNSFKDNVRHIMYSYIVQDMIRDLGPQIMSHVSIGLSIIQEVLQSQVSTIQSLIPGPTMSINKLSLGSIIQDDNTEKRENDMSDLENTLSICLPWLTIVLQQETSPESHRVKERVASVQVLLETFLRIATISQATRHALRSTIILLSNSLNGPGFAELTKGTKLEDDMELHARALKNLQAAEIPVRVQGLTELEKLVVQKSSLVSVSSAVLTVLALLQDQDSFVYLSAVKTLVNLAKEDPQSTIKTLQEAYQDITEQSTIDVRLRTGEAIQTIVEEMGKSVPAPPILHLVELLLHMSSRRALRKKADMTSNQSGVSLTIKDQEDDADSDMDIDEINAERDAETVLKSWQGKFGVEDLRLRTSALTILSTVFEFTNFSVTVSFLKPTLDLIFRILNEEKGQQNAIIRRAATMTVLSMVKGAEDSQTDTALTASSANIEDIVSLRSIDTLFAAIAIEDEDELVRGHAEELVKAIKDWREESFAQLLRGDTIRFGLKDNNGNARLRGIDLDIAAGIAQHNQSLPKVEELD